MAQAAGLECEFDAELYHALRNSRGELNVFLFYDNTKISVIRYIYILLLDGIYNNSNILFLLETKQFNTTALCASRV